MTALLTSERQEAIMTLVTEIVEESLREPVKEAVKEAMQEADVGAESTDTGGSRSRGLVSSVRLVGLGVAIGYALRGRELESLDLESLEETKSQLAETVQEKEEELSEAESFEEVDITEGGDEGEDEAEADADGGRNVLPGFLFVLGTAVLGYALKSRFGAVEEVADEAVDRASDVTEAGTVTDESAETSTGEAETDERVEEVGTGERDEDEDDESA